MLKPVWTSTVSGLSPHYLITSRSYDLVKLALFILIHSEPFSDPLFFPRLLCGSNKAGGNTNSSSTSCQLDNFLVHSMSSHSMGFLLWCWCPCPLWAGKLIWGFQEAFNKGSLKCILPINQSLHPAEDVEIVEGKQGRNPLVYSHPCRLGEKLANM